MFKYTLAATLDEMDREGITVAECPLRSMRCLSLQNGRIVGINTARFDSSAAAQAGGKFGVGDVLEHGGFVGPVFGLRFELVGRIRQIERAAGKVPVLVDQGGAHLGGRIKPRYGV